jgi:hypothetical protein
VYDTVQIVGSLLILAAFVLAMTGRLSQASVGYLVLNIVGSAVLAVTATISREWGFILLVGVWALVSLRALVRELRTGPRRPDTV